jgi:hypothetical protein
MRPLPALALLAALGLAACQTPREACISEATRELRTIESLIRETEGNLQRGYAIETEQEVDVVRDFCNVELEDGADRLIPCDRTVVDEVERPVAIDLRDEQGQLDSLLERREILLGQQNARLRACVAAYPE